MQSGLYRTTCLMAARFDRLFGNERIDTDYRSTHGILSAGIVSSESDHFEGVSKFRLHARLPRLSRRLGVFIGQDDSDEGAPLASTGLGPMRRPFGLEQDDELLIGLGYRQPAFGGGTFDTSVGAHLDSGLDPYFRGRYRIAKPLRARNVLRLTETLFWQGALGAGGTSRLDVDRLLNERFLARWTGAATVATRTHGVRWFSGATLYQSVGAGRALAYQVGISGESRAEVPVSDYGVQILFRRRVLREWMFLELSTGVSWPLSSAAEVRDRDLSCGLSLEMRFGKTGSSEG